MNITTITEKECSICGIIKPITEFYKQQKKRKDGTTWIYHNPECKECTKKKSIKWKLEHPENVTKSNRKTNQKRHDYLMQYKRENKEQYKAYTRNWQRNNPEKIKEFNAYRQQHKTHKITNEEWEACKNYFNYRCCYCGLPIEEHYIMYKGKLKLGDFHKEHTDYNGANDLSNCVPSCRSCNSSKRQSTLSEWYNDSNEHFTYERLEKINQWLENDYLKYIHKDK